MNLNLVKSKLESQVCSSHHEHPSITIKGEGFTISCCCEEFQKKLVELSTKYIGELAKQEIENSIKKAFR